MGKRFLSMFVSIALLAGLLPNMALASEASSAPLSTQAGAPTVTSVSASENFTAAVLDDDTLWMWGENASGQLGDSTTTNRSRAVKVLDNVKSVSLGANHSAAVTQDGRLYTWGSNSKGQLGDGSTTDSAKPIEIMSDVEEVALGASFSIALKSDRTVWTWGMNGYGTTVYGCLGDGSVVAERHLPKQIMAGVSKIAAGGSCGAAIKNGTLYMWGQNYQGALGDGTTTNHNSPVSIMSDVSAVELNGFHAAAIADDGVLYTWGQNSSGQLGIGTSIRYSTVPVKAASDAIGATCSMHGTAFVKGDGSVYACGKCFGVNDESFTKVDELSNISSLAMGFGHYCALSENGSLVTWGRNTEGQLGNGMNSDTNEPAVWQIDPILDIANADIAGIDAVTYTGTSQTPTLDVTYRGAKLHVGTDYQLDYRDNLHVGTATITVTGIGEYEGSRNIEFEILPALISSTRITYPASTRLSGATATPKPVVSFNGTTLAENIDYTLSYTNNTAIGTAQMRVDGIGDFTGSTTRAFTVIADPEDNSGTEPKDNSSTNPQASPTTSTDPVPDAPSLRYGIDNSRLSISDITPAADFEYSLTDDDEMVIWWYHGTSKKVVVPATIEGYTVMGIENGGFKGNTNIEEVYLPDTLTTIESNMFEGCTSLRCVNLGGIRRGFNNRTQEGYTTGESGYTWLLHRCTSLERLTMADSANFTITKQYGAKHFNIMYEDVTNSLKYIYIGSSMTDVPESLFFGDSLQAVDVGAGNTQLSSAGGVVYNADGSKLIVMGTGYEGSYEIQQGCQSIGAIGFQSCAKLTSVFIPESVKSIEKQAFSGTNPTIVTPQGSYAAFFAQQYNIPVRFQGVATDPYEPPSSQENDAPGATTDDSPSDSTGESSNSSENAMPYDTHDETGTLPSTSSSYPSTTLYANEQNWANELMYRPSWTSKLPNSLQVTTIAKTVKFKKVKKKARVLKALSITGAIGTVSYANVSTLKKLKKFKVNTSTGKITVPKGIKRGTYKVLVRVTASGDLTHEAATQTVTCKVKVK